MKSNASTASPTWVHAALATFATLAACGDRPPGGASGDGDGPPEWRVDELVRIGSLDDPDQSLVTIGDVRIGPGGALYVVQPADAQIRVYGPDGELRARVGARGEGPGEFRFTNGIGLRGDTLYVADAGLHRLSFFAAADGAFLRSEQWSPHRVQVQADPTTLLRSASFTTSAPRVLRADGSGLVSPSIAATVSAADLEPGPRRRRLPRLLFTVRPESSALDTIVLYYLEGASNSVAVSGGGTVSVSCPFISSPLVELMADGSGAARVDRAPAGSLAPASYGVTLLGPSGDTLFSTSIPYDPVPVGSALPSEIEVIRNREIDRNRPAPSASDIESALREVDCVPPTLPPVRALVTAQDGTIWVRRDEGPGDFATWDVVGPDGRWVGQLRLRAAETVAAALGDVLVTRELGDFDVPYLTRYRLTR